MPPLSSEVTDLIDLVQSTQWQNLRKDTITFSAVLDHTGNHGQYSSFSDLYSDLKDAVASGTSLEALVMIRRGTGGTYGDITIDEDHTTFIFGAGCNVGEITLSGDGNTLIFGPGCTVDKIVPSGTDNYILGLGDALVSEGVADTGAAINATGHRNKIEGIHVNAAANGSSSFSGIVLDEDCMALFCRIIDADEFGISVSGPNAAAIGCLVETSDEENFDFSDDQLRAIVQYPAGICFCITAEHPVQWR